MWRQPFVTVFLVHDAFSLERVDYLDNKDLIKKGNDLFVPAAVGNSICFSSRNDISHKGNELCAFLKAAQEHYFSSWCSNAILLQTEGRRGRHVS